MAKLHGYLILGYSVTPEHGRDFVADRVGHEPRKVCLLLGPSAGDSGLNTVDRGEADISGSSHSVVGILSYVVPRVQPSVQATRLPDDRSPLSRLAPAVGIELHQPNLRMPLHRREIKRGFGPASRTEHDQAGSKGRTVDVVEKASQLLIRRDKPTLFAFDGCRLPIQNLFDLRRRVRDVEILDLRVRDRGGHDRHIPRNRLHRMRVLSRCPCDEQRLAFLVEIEDPWRFGRELCLEELQDKGRGAPRRLLGRTFVGAIDKVSLEHHREMIGRVLRASFYDDFREFELGGFKSLARAASATDSASSGLIPEAVESGPAFLDGKPTLAEFEQGWISTSGHGSTRF